MVLSLDKGERGKKQPKGIEEVKASQPENRFDIDNLNKTANHQDIKPKRGKGRPRKNKSTKMIRVSDEAVDIINAYKQATGQESQDDAIIDVFRRYVIDSGLMEIGQKQVFDLLLDVKKAKDNFYKDRN